MGTAFRGVAGTPIEKASTFGEREIFVGGLPLDTNDNDLVLFFSRWGHVEGARVMYYRSTGVSRRFGFVRFANVHVAMAVKALKKTDFPDGTEVVVGDIKLAKEMQEANEDTSSSPENCVNSSGISRTSSDVSESDLRNLGHALRAIAFGDPSGEKRSEKNGSGIDSNSSSSPSTSDSPPLSDTGTPGATSNASTVDTEEHGGSGSGNEMLSGPAETNAAAKRSTSPPTVLRRRYPLVDCK
jgi:RNA recognition motif-containing protein